MNSKPAVFLAFSLGDSSVSDFFVELSNALESRYTVVVISDKLNDRPAALSPDVQVTYWPSNRPTRWRDALFFSKLVREYRPQLVISMFGSVNLVTCISWMFCVQHRLIWLRTISTHFFHKKTAIWRKQLVYRMATQFIANSEATRLDVAHVYKVPIAKIKVIHNSVKPYDKPDEEVDNNRITYVGRLYPAKGVDTLIRAFHRLASSYPNLYLELVGDGPQRGTLQDLVQNLGLAERVHFLGVLSKSDVIAQFSKSYCAVVPSTSEAFGFTVIEAMSAATCVIGANNTGIKEIILHEETGLLFETSSDVDLAQKIEQILTDSNWRNHLALAGNQRVQTHFSIASKVTETVQFLRDLK